MPASTRRSAIMRQPKYKPSLHLTGKSAKALLKAQVGKRVTLAVKGRVISQGINTYEVGRPATATIEIDEVR